MSHLILVRHGQSLWNLENRFTGWVDVELSKKGRNEASYAGKLLNSIKFDRVFSSDLMRTVETAEIISNEINYKNIHLLTTYHPSSLLMDENLKKQCWEDFKKIKKYYNN